MKILMLAHGVIGDGVGTVVYSLYKSIVNLGNKCDIASYQELSTESPIHKKIEEDNNRYIVIKRIRQAGIKEYIRQIRSVCIEGKYDVIHIHTSLFIWLAAYAAKKAGIPVRIGHAHGNTNPDYSSLFRMILEPLGRYLNRKLCTGFVGCSSLSSQYTFGRSAVYIPNYVFKESILGVSYEQINRERIKWSNDSTTKIFAYMGRLEKHKNVFFMLDVMMFLRDKGMNVILLLIGEGELHDELCKQISKLNLANHIHLLGQRNDCNVLVQAIDYYISSSMSEGMSLSMLEAQMAGKPCFISGLIPKESDIGIGLFHAIDGFDASQWADVIIKSISSGTKPIDREKAISMAEEQGMTEKPIIQKLLKVYQSGEKGMRG